MQNLQGELLGLHRINLTKSHILFYSCTHSVFNTIIVKIHHHRC